MSDDRIGLFILLIAAWMILGAVTEYVHQVLDRYARRDKDDKTAAEGCFLIVLTMLIFQPPASSWAAGSTSSSGTPSR